MTMRLSPSARTALFRQLATALRHKVPLASVTAILAEDPEWFGSDGAGAKDLLRLLSRGETVPSTMGSYPGLFAAETVELVKLAEQAGLLAEVFDGLAMDCSGEGESSRLLRQALVWPLTVICVATIIFVTMMVFVIPHFQSFYETMGAPLPNMTLRLIALSRLVHGYWWAGMLVALLGLGIYRRDPSGHGLAAPIRSGIYLVPFVKRYLSGRLVARLANWLYIFRDHPSLTPAAIAHLNATTTTPRLRRALKAVKQGLAQGMPLSQALAADPALPRRISLFAKLGETLRSFEEPLAQLKELLETEESTALGRLERGLILSLYVLIAAAVGGLVLGLYEPLFQLGAVISS